MTVVDSVPDDVEPCDGEGQEQVYGGTEQNNLQGSYEPAEHHSCVLIADEVSCFCPVGVERDDTANTQVSKCQGQNEQILSLKVENYQSMSKGWLKKQANYVYFYCAYHMFSSAFNMEVRLR